MQREYVRQWVASRRAAWFADKVCVDCGTEENLQLDHVDPSQKVSHSIWSWSQVRRDVETAKCEVRCQPCHVVKTKVNQENYGNRKITSELAEEIRTKYASGEVLQRDLGEEYSLSQTNISRIVLGTLWV